MSADFTKTGIEARERVCVCEREHTPTIQDKHQDLRLLEDHKYIKRFAF